MKISRSILSTNQLTVEELLWGIDVDTLKLRQARKIVKALGIAQKVNCKDQKLTFLWNQLELKLQQVQLLKSEIEAAVVYY